MTLYRVFPYDAAAPPSQPGGALYTPLGAAGRISNPELYNELYLSSSASGALSEAFGRFDAWTQAMFVTTRPALRARNLRTTGSSRNM